MNLSKKCRYAIRALIDLSANSENAYTVLGSVAERNNISPQYLEQVFSTLRKAGIVKGIKGSQGGYRLNVDPKKLTVAEIMEALDGDYHIDAEEIPEDSHGKGIADSMQRLIIDRVNEQLDQTLKNITLEELRKNYIDYQEMNQEMYYI